MTVSADGIPMRSCRVVARYGGLVSTPYANVFEDRWLTMPQFRRLVERFDQRLVDAQQIGMLAAP